jgi:hypothetical protein
MIKSDAVRMPRTPVQHNGWLMEGKPGITIVQDEIAPERNDTDVSPLSADERAKAGHEQYMNKHLHASRTKPRTPNAPHRSNNAGKFLSIDMKKQEKYKQYEPPTKFQMPKYNQAVRKMFVQEQDQKEGKIDNPKEVASNEMKFVYISAKKQVHLNSLGAIRSAKKLRNAK